LENYGIYINVRKGINKTKDGHLLYFADCSVCGKTVEKRLITLQKNNIVCNHNNRIYNIKNKRIKRIFKHMIERCYNPKNKNYKFYGGLGIKIYEEWMKNPESFEIWAVSSGYSYNLTIDRIDGYKWYCPENCRWITLEENVRDKKSTRYIDIDNLHLSGRQWAEKLGTGTNFINTYFRNNGEEATVEYIKSKLE
jgi:hypothetical protein